MPSIRRTAQAEEDLIDIWLYIAPDNPGAANRLLDEIEDKCSLLADNPQIGPARRTSPRTVGIFPWAAISFYTTSSRMASSWSGWCKAPAVWKISFPEPETL